MPQLKPSYGDRVDIFEHVEARWTEARVLLLLSAQFTYRTLEDNHHGFMLYQSPNWRQHHVQDPRS